MHLTPSPTSALYLGPLSDSHLDDNESLFKTLCLPPKPLTICSLRGCWDTLKFTDLIIRIPSLKSFNFQSKTLEWLKGYGWLGTSPDSVLPSSLLQHWGLFSVPGTIQLLPPTHVLSPVPCGRPAPAPSPVTSYLTFLLSCYFIPWEVCSVSAGRACSVQDLSSAALCTLSFIYNICLWPVFQRIMFSSLPCITHARHRAQHTIGTWCVFLKSFVKLLIYTRLQPSDPRFPPLPSPSISWFGSCHQVASFCSNLQAGLISP